MAYSKDFRQMILAKLKGGASFRELTDEFQLSTSTIQRWKKNPERKKRLFKPFKIDNEQLKADVAAYPDDYQWQRAQRFGCSQNAIGVALKRLGITLKKKTLIHPKADPAKQALFLEQLSVFEQAGKQIVYLDESGFKAHDHRSYGYAQKGKPCVSWGWTTR